MKNTDLDILVSDNGKKALSGVGIGLKPQHYQEILTQSPALGWFEVHAENYMGQGGAPHHYLSQICQQYPLSIHGVGLSIGGAEPLDKDHLKRLKILNDRYQPALFSEHLAWSSHGGQFFNDLLPLPYTAQTLQTVCGHIDELQHTLGRQVLLENPASYICFADNSFSEPDFLAQIADRTGAGLLLDINNVYVSAHNNNFSPERFIEDFNLDAVKEIHLAGHGVDAVALDQGQTKTKTLLIDDHGAPICGDVWSLYQNVLSKIGAVPTLIERDNNIPALNVLVAEARQAHTMMEKAGLCHV